MKIQTPTRGVQTFLQRREVQSAVDLKSRQDAQANGPVDVSVQAIEINRRHLGVP